VGRLLYGLEKKEVEKHVAVGQMFKAPQKIWKARINEVGNERCSTTMGPPFQK